MPVFRLFFLAFLLLPWLVVGQGLQFNTRTFEYNNEPLKVKKVFQAQNGFIYLGTASGLFRYDGLETKPMVLAGSNKKLPSVTAIFQDKNQTLWVGTENGQIFQLKHNQLIQFEPKEANPKADILAIQEDLQTNIWFATYGEGLYCFKQNRLFHFTTREGLPDDYLYTLALDEAGNTWAGTDRGIAICNFRSAKIQIQNLGMSEGLPDNIVTALALCPAKKTIWAGTYSGGFCTIDAKTLKIAVPEISETWNYGAITRILPNGATTSFIGTQGKGVFEFDRLQPANILPVASGPAATSKVSDLLYGQEGLLWVTGGTAELYLANPAVRFLPVDQRSGIHAVLATKAGDIWFSTDAGLFRATKKLNGFQTQPVFTQLPFGKFKVISLYEDKQGLVWAGTFGGGVFCLELGKEKVVRYTSENGLVNDNVLSITGRGDEIWLATLGGASRTRLAPGAAGKPLQFENFNQQDGIGFNYIYQVFTDAQNRLWFATDGKGLTKLENGRFTSFSEKDGLLSRTIYSIAQTNDGAIWVSTAKNGLFKYNGRRFENFTIKEGLRDLNISSLATDKAGNLLILHKAGLDILEYKTGKLRHLGEESGLALADLGLNTISRDAAGTVWFATQKGIAAYQPALKPLPVQPKAQLTSVQLFLKTLPESIKPSFAHDENHISFEYAGLWYQNPKEVTYRLKLEGYDREWIVSNNRSITYPKLPPGNYTFKVSASANGNFDNAQPVAYTFEIKKPFWSTYWFYTLALAASSGLLFGLVKGREKRLKKAGLLEKDKVMFQFETLKNQVNPHFLFNSFNTLIGIIEDDQEAAVAYVEKLSDFFRDILVYREKDTITLREELVLIRNYYFLQQKRYGSNLQMEINVPETDLDLLIAPLTLQLLVENAIKHNVVSRDKPLTIQIATETGPILVVRNNLQKKMQPEKSTGIGLENIRKRYHILTRRPVLVTENATLFEVKIPLFSPPEL